MSQLIATSARPAGIVRASAISAPRLPAPRRGAVRVREATMDDLPFIDALQKRTTRQVGWMPTAQLEGKIRLREVLVAERGQRSEIRGQTEDSATNASELTSDPCPLTSLGYLIGSDRYFKHDDVGIIYQVNVIESERRGLVAATLLKAQFDRSAYGCRLYCCWCAQDLEANRFWEAMGFVPLAFRTGSATRGRKVGGGQGGRVHIFWQKRIREGDDVTPWWFPCATTSGSVRGDRIVLPIPPGVHWSDEMPVVLPEEATERRSDEATEGPETRRLPAPAPSSLRRSVAPSLSPQRGFGDAARLRFARAQIEHRVRLGELQMSALHEALAAERAAIAQAKRPAKQQPAKEAKKARKSRPPAKKADPRHIALARELRDRWLEEIAADPSLILPSPRYEVSRMLPEATRRVMIEHIEPRALPAAA